MYKVIYYPLIILIFTFITATTAISQTKNTDGYSKIYIWGHIYDNDDTKKIIELYPVDISYILKGKKIESIFDYSLNGKNGLCIIDINGEKFCSETGILGSFGKIADANLGEYYSDCTVDENHQAWCWGDNETGRVGDDTTSFREAPVKVKTTVLFQSISSGSFSTCGISLEGDAWCWGDNSAGQIGNGRTRTAYTPKKVKAPNGVKFKQVDIQYKAVQALDEKGHIWIWGEGANGKKMKTPKLFSDAHSFSSIQLTHKYACGLEDKEKAIYCWGLAYGLEKNYDRKIKGIHNYLYTGEPQKISGNIKIKDFDVTQITAAAIDEDGNRYAWLMNSGTYGNGEIWEDAIWDNYQINGQVIIEGEKITNIKEHAEKTVLKALEAEKNGEDIYTWHKNKAELKMFEHLTLENAKPIEGPVFDKVITGTTRYYPFVIGLQH